MKKRNQNISIEQLYLQNKDKVYGFLLLHIKDSFLAEDMLQDIFIKLLRKNSEEKIHDVESYLFVMARNTIIDYWRKAATNHRIKKEFLQNIINNNTDYIDPFETSEQQTAVDNSIAKLTPQQKKVFTLYRDKGLSYKEIAIKLNLSRNTVRNHMIASRKKVKEYVARHNLLNIVLIITQVITSYAILTLVYKILHHFHS